MPKAYHIFIQSYKIRNEKTSPSFQNLALLSQYIFNVLLGLFRCDTIDISFLIFKSLEFYLEFYYLKHYILSFSAWIGNI